MSRCLLLVHQRVFIKVPQTMDFRVSDNYCDFNTRLIRWNSIKRRLMKDALTNDKAKGGTRGLRISPNCRNVSIDLRKALNLRGGG